MSNFNIQRYPWNKGELVPLVDAGELGALNQMTEQMVVSQDASQSVQPQELQLHQTADLTTTRTQGRFPF